jgi:hypothetical protein
MGNLDGGNAGPTKCGGGLEAAYAAIRKWEWGVAQ